MTIEIDDSDLHAFLDGQLDPKQEGVVLAYLDANPEARERLRGFAEQKLLVAIGEDERRAGGSTDATERLARELAARLPARGGFPWMRRSAVAAMLVGLGWLGHAGYGQYVAPKTPLYVVEAAGAHMVFAEERERPVEVPAERRDEVEAWLSDRLGQEVEVPDLAEIGLEFVGGRLLGSIEGPLAGLMYEDRSGHRMTLCLSPDGEAATPEIQVLDIGQVAAGYWSDGEQSYAIVADTSEPQLIAIAQEIARTTSGRR